MLVSKGFWCLNRIGKVYQCLYAWNFMVIPVIGKAGEMTAWKGNKRESPLLINDNNVPIKMVLYKGICVRVNVCNLYINMSHQQTVPMLRNTNSSLRAYFKITIYLKKTLFYPFAQIDFCCWELKNRKGIWNFFCCEIIIYILELWFKSIHCSSIK